MYKLKYMRKVSISSISVNNTISDSKLILKTAINNNKDIAKFGEICFCTNDFLLRVDKLFQNLTYI